MNKNECSIVYLSEFTARFCTWSILSQLLVHLIDIHWKTPSQQIYIVGASLSLLYLSAIFGGLVRDWLLHGKQVIILGIALISFGSFLLLLNSSLFYPGLSLALLGAGMVTPNTPLLLSSLAGNNGGKKFTILYGVTNAGVILGSILGGIINVYFSWKAVLILNELIVLAWLAFSFSFSWTRILKDFNRTKLIKVVIALIFVVFVAYSYLKFKLISETLLIIFGITYLGFLVFFIINNPTIRKELIFSTFLITLAIIFFSAEFQVASTLIGYTHHFVILNIAHMPIPAGSILALESIFVVIGAFVISRIKLFSDIIFVRTKVFLGLLLGMSAFVVLYSSTLFAAYNQVSVMWIVFASLLLGLGDVCLMPPIMEYITKITPSNYQGRFMAGMYFSLSISGYLSGLIGTLLLKHIISANTDLHFYSVGFGVMIPILGGAAALLFLTKIISVNVYSKY